MLLTRLSRMEIGQRDSSNDDRVAKTEFSVSRSPELCAPPRGGAARRHWHKPRVAYTLMFGLFVFALLVAVGHHRFYLYLHACQVSEVSIASGKFPPPGKYLIVKTSQFQD